jgi:superfamily II DNA or RNA helicase
MATEMTQASMKIVAVNPHGVKDRFEPYPHQVESAQKMTKHFLDKQKRAGLLVLPTGGGKTSVTARWLLRHCVSEGKRVLWLAHRHSLLIQAFDDFARQAHLATPLKQLGLIMVGGQMKSWSNVEGSHQVVFSTMQTTGRVGNLGYVEQMWTDSPQGMVIVIDEAHHAAAPSYWRIATQLKGKARVQWLGLTATPVRTQADDEARLWSMFDREIIHQVDVKDLIEQEILANPHYSTHKTDINFEKDFTAEDLKHLEKYGELGAKVLERVGQHSGRNRFIVQHYIDNQAKYGKTIVFATNILHARTLHEEFSRRGVSVDYVDHHRGKENAQIMKSFREKTIPKVLINVEMLTEGFDAPDTQTVFIARPTNSESLVSQMAGRALRGLKAKGTKDAYLVTFVDTWERFQVLTPEFLPGIAGGEVTDPETQRRLPVHLQEVSQELLIAAYNMVNSNLRGELHTVFSCVPHSWYVWEEQYEDNSVRKTVMIFDNQVEGFSQLSEELDRWPDQVTVEEHGQDLLDTYFASCPDPRPRMIDLCGFVNAMQRWRNPELNNEDDAVQISKPESYTFEEKALVAPEVIARKLLDEELPRRQELARFKEIFEQEAVLKLIYRDDFKSFSEALSRAMDALNEAAEEGPPTPPAIVEVVNQVTERVKGWPDGGEGYSLQQIWETVCAPKAHFRGDPPLIHRIEWIDSKRVWGFFRYEDKVVGVNKILNSPDIPLFVVEFLIYHEGLHADMPNSGHDASFRERERRFTPSEEAIADASRRGIVPGGGSDGWRTRADQVLDTFHHRFLWAPPKQEM